jgi:hypothetical protein
MRSWQRWIGLAVFCAAFGLIGAMAGLWVMNDQLRGPQGATGPSGGPGPQGPAGPPGDSAIKTGTWGTDLETVLNNFARELRDLSDHIDAVDQGVGQTGPGSCTPTWVVTNAYEVGVMTKRLQVDRVFTCLPKR